MELSTENTEMLEKNNICSFFINNYKNQKIHHASGSFMYADSIALGKGVR